MGQAFKVGFVGSYIQDEGFDFVTNLPVETAVLLAQTACPDAMLGTAGTASEMTANANAETDATWNGWMNNYFVIVGDTPRGDLIALANHDGQFGMYLKTCAVAP